MTDYKVDDYYALRLSKHTDKVRVVRVVSVTPALVTAVTFSAAVVRLAPAEFADYVVAKVDSFDRAAAARACER